LKLHIGVSPEENGVLQTGGGKGGGTSKMRVMGGQITRASWICTWPFIKESKPWAREYWGRGKRNSGDASVQGGSNRPGGKVRFPPLFADSSFW